MGNQHRLVTNLSAQLQRCAGLVYKADWILTAFWSSYPMICDNYNTNIPWWSLPATNAKWKRRRFIKMSRTERGACETLWNLVCCVRESEMAILRTVQFRMGSIDGDNNKCHSRRTYTSCKMRAWHLTLNARMSQHKHKQMQNEHSKLPNEIKNKHAVHIFSWLHLCTHNIANVYVHLAFMFAILMSLIFLHFSLATVEFVIAAHNNSTIHSSM